MKIQGNHIKSIVKTACEQPHCCRRLVALVETKGEIFID